MGKDFDADTLATSEPGGTGSAAGEAGSLTRYDTLEVGAGGTTNLEPPGDPPPEELPPEVQEDADENASEILSAQSEERAAPDDEEDRARQEDEEGEQDEGDEEASEGTAAGESGEDEREGLPMCPA